MTESQISNRCRLRKKVIRDLSKKFNQTFSMDLALEHSTVDLALMDEFEILIINNEVLGIILDNVPFLTIRGILHYKPTVKFATVDMGAVKFIANGADIMSPGVVDADVTLEAGDLVWIRDENNLKPLAIGRCVMSGAQMIKSSSDKAIRSIHYIGDKLWNLQI